jgi:hypothetical protein
MASLYDVLPTPIRQLFACPVALSNGETVTQQMISKTIQVALRIALLIGTTLVLSSFSLTQELMFASLAAGLLLSVPTTCLALGSLGMVPIGFTIYQNLTVPNPGAFALPTIWIMAAGVAVLGYMVLNSSGQFEAPHLGFLEDFIIIPFSDRVAKVFNQTPNEQSAHRQIDQ